jgi:alpha-L-fucosidase
MIRILGRWRLAARVVVLTAVLSLVSIGVAAPPAHAELFSQRQDWMRNATAGLFLHWGLGTNNQQAPDPATGLQIYHDCAQWEQALDNGTGTTGKWTPDHWVQAAQQLHAQYLVLASFHSRLGYARPWPSQFPGSCSTKRDFLKETIDAAKAKGLKVILYMTDDPKWYWETWQPSAPPDPTDPADMAKPSWLDSAAYNAHMKSINPAHVDVNLHTRPGFGEYSYNNMLEIVKNPKYKDIGGFWIDNLNQYWMDPKNDPDTTDPTKQLNLFEKVRKLRSNWLLSNNNEDTPLFDTVSNEQKTGMTPPYDYNSALWTSMPRLTESDYKLPNFGGWWYDGEGPTKAGGSPVDYKLAIGRLISNVGASSKALQAQTSHIDGTFPANQVAYDQFVSDYLGPIWESIHGVEGGGYMYGGLKPGAWNDGAYGYTTIKKDDHGEVEPDTQYIHVIDRPTGDTLKMRDNGYLIDKVTDLRTGKRLRFSQSAGTLTISGVTNWDPYDTVFKVRADQQRGAYPNRTITASASVSAPGFDASKLVDGDYYAGYWDNNATLPATITLDLGQSKKAAYLAINQREWSSTQPRKSFGHLEDSARIKGYSLDVSTDGTTWSTVITCATMPSARGVQFVDLGVVKARFIRLTVTSTWAAANLTEYANKLKIDEMRVGAAYPNGDTAPVTADGGAGCPTGGGA